MIKKSFLQLDKDGKLSMSTIHDYYYQVQGQLSICNKPYCDFICWTKKGIFCERIFKNANFFDLILPSLKAFFLKFILPELLTNSIKSGHLAESPPHHVVFNSQVYHVLTILMMCSNKKLNCIKAESILKMMMFHIAYANRVHLGQ